ncbi:MAG: sigma-70 family RNA polymerase sigma factor [Clostridia bacterium]|nr:sigma-70 family RNA polymerase sigma factor [Clostridia bacterium]
MLVFSALTAERRSDKELIEYIYRQYYPLMRYVAGRILMRESPDAEDAVHDAMVKIIRNVGIIKSSDKKKLKNLCCIVARNCALDRARKKDGNNFPLSELSEEAPSADPPAEQAAIVGETFDAIMRAIGSLPELYRDACVLKYVHGYKEKEVASLLGLPERTASTRIHRGKMLLRETLRKEGYHE